jgi:hypothetical protein
MHLWIPRNQLSLLTKELNKIMSVNCAFRTWGALSFSYPESSFVQPIADSCILQHTEHNINYSTSSSFINSTIESRWMASTVYNAVNVFG